jgi:hypothetical protein
MDMKAGGYSNTLLMTCYRPFAKTCDHKANQKKVLLNTFFMDVYEDETPITIWSDDSKDLKAALPYTMNLKGQHHEHRKQFRSIT